MIYAPDCICGRHLLQRENEGTCLLCGHGLVDAIVEHAYRRNMERVDPELDRERFRVEGERARRSFAHLGGARRGQWTAERCIEAAREWERIYGSLPVCTDWATADGDQVEHPRYETILRRFGGWQAFMREIADIPRERIAA